MTLAVLVVFETFEQWLADVVVDEEWVVESP